MSEFRTTHNLAFEVAPWEPFIPVPMTEGYMRFRIGTCEGLWTSDETSYKILAIDNTVPGNGHLQDVFEWFENSCRRDRKWLVVQEIMNKEFRTHLIKKRGFKPYRVDDVIKKRV